MERTATLTNADLGELLWHASPDEPAHRRRALERTARAARFWPSEAGDLIAAGAPLTGSHGVGSWVATRIEARVGAPPHLTYAEVRAVLDEDPTWETAPHGGLHTRGVAAVPLRLVNLRRRKAG